MSTLKLDFGPVRKCDCSAHNQDECICGAWDDHGNLRPYAEEIVRLKRELAAMAAEVDAWRSKPIVDQLCNFTKEVCMLRTELARLTKERDALEHQINVLMECCANKDAKYESTTAGIRRAMERLSDQRDVSCSPDARSAYQWARGVIINETGIKLEA